MYIDSLVDVAKKELSWEVDYSREAECTKKFKKLLEPHENYYVPDVIGKFVNFFIFIEFGLYVIEKFFLRSCR